MLHISSLLLILLSCSLFISFHFVFLLLFFHFYFISILLLSFLFLLSFSIFIITSQIQCSQCIISHQCFTYLHCSWVSYVVPFLFHFMLFCSSILSFLFHFYLASVLFFSSFILYLYHHHKSSVVNVLLVINASHIFTAPDSPMLLSVHFIKIFLCLVTIFHLRYTT